MFETSGKFRGPEKGAGKGAGKRKERIELLLVKGFLWLD